VTARDKHDFPATTTLNHMPRYQLTHVKPTRQCTLDHFRKGVGTELQELSPPLKRRIAHKNVDLPQGIDRLADYGPAGHRLEYVARNEYRPPVQRLDLGNHCLSFRRSLSIVDHNISSCAGKFECTASPDPSAGPSHECLLAKKLHLCAPARERDAV
jgi:hypothetical protein